MQRSLILFLGIGLLSLQVQASCGTASCSLNAHLDAFGLGNAQGWNAGLRYEYIDQDTLRNGTREVSIGEIPQHHDEVYTLNRNLLATLDYNSTDWGVSITIPYVQREHYHIHTHLGVPYDERWDIAALGDVSVLSHIGQLQLGLKLPTGDTQQTNADGEFAERTLQPGTGTTDLILGYNTSHTTSIWNNPGYWFMQAQLQTPLAQHDNFRIGTQYRFDVGVVSMPGKHFNPSVQLNAVIADRDEGDEAETDSSGGEYVWLTPGLNSHITNELRVFGFVQIPLYQRVNGVQLVADWTATVGMNWEL